MAVRKLTPLEKSELSLRKAETEVAASATKAENAIRYLEMGIESNWCSIDVETRQAAEKFLLEYFQERS